MNRHPHSIQRAAGRDFRRRPAPGRSLGLYLPVRRGPGRAGSGARGAAARRPRRRVRAQRLRAHRPRQHGHRDRQAPRDGPGHLHRPRHARRRGARRRVGAGARRGRAGRRQPLQQPRSGARCRAPAARRRWPIPGSSCARPAPPPARCWSPRPPSSGTCRPPTITVRSGVVIAAAARKATFGELAAAAAKQPVPADDQAQGPEGLRLHRQARAAQGLDGEDRRHGAATPPTSSCPAC